ncbi:MAG TPA: hypothetical protein VLB01_02495 [Thermodesulfobacteriota bacterium]|nr:hypothetical protein [Thermodesulfobacteriota bacterium]
MNSIFMVFVVQLILCTLLFILIYHFIKKNGELKREIETLKEDISAKKRGT